MRDVTIADQNLALRRLLETRDQSQHRALAAARRPDEHEQLAVADREVGVVHGDVAVAIDFTYERRVTEAIVGA